MKESRQSTIVPRTTPATAEQKETTWIVQLEEDPETGDLIMPLPDGLLESQGWKIGDTLEWDVNKTTNELSLTKAK